jgi:hypothetical protein
MAEAKHKPDQAQETKTEGIAYTRFLSDEEAAIELAKAPSEIKKVRRDPFTRKEKVQYQDLGFDALLEAYQNGEVTAEDVRAQMRDMYRLNHSTGSDILDDDRKTTETRIKEYTEFAVANGQTFEEAQDHAITYLLKKGAERGTLAGNWGTIRNKRDVRRKKR